MRWRKRSKKRRANDAIAHNGTQVYDEKIYRCLSDISVVEPFLADDGTADGINGDHFLLCPPFIIKAAELDELFGILDEALSEFESSN